MSSGHSDLVRQAVAAADEENWELSLGLWQQVYDSKPSYKATGFLAKSLEKAERFEDARALYLKAIEKWPNGLAFRAGYARTSAELGDWEVAERHWTDLVTQAPDNYRWTLMLARSQQNLGKINELFETLRQARKKWPNNERVSERSKEAYYRFSDDEQFRDDLPSNFPGEHVSYGDQWRWVQSQLNLISNTEYAELLVGFCEKWKERKAPLRALAKWHVSHGNYEDAIKIYKNMESFGRRTRSDIFRLSMCFVLLGREDEARGKFQEYVAVETDNNELQNQMGLFLVRASDVGFAESVLREAIANICKGGIDGKAGAAVDLQPLLDFHRSIRSPLRPVSKDWDNNIEVSASAPSVSGDVFMIFTGYGRDLGAVPIEFMDQFLAGHGASLIRIADHTGCLCQNGVQQLAPDFEATIVQLKKLLDSLEARRLFTIGTSGGGFGALRYGAELGAESVLLFSGPTNLSMKFLEDNKEIRARAVIKRLNRDLHPEQLDVISQINALPHKPRIDAYFANDNPGDKIQALNFFDVPHVHLHPLENTDDHRAIGTAFLRGQLQAELERMLHVSTVTE